MKGGYGVFPDWKINSMIEKGLISLDSKYDTGIISDGQVQSSLFDLCLSDEVGDVTVMRGNRERLPIRELFRLKKGWHVRTDGRSSHSAKSNLSVAVVTEDGVSVPPGYDGRLFVEVTPRSSNVRLRSGDSLVQARFYMGHPEESIISIDEILRKGLEVITNGEYTRYNDGLLLFLDVLRGGLKTKYTGKTFDMSAMNKESDFFDLITGCSQYGISPDALYLFFTKERMQIPPNAELPFVAEMEKFNHNGISTQEAGFIDYGFPPTPQAAELSTTEERIIYDGKEPCLVRFYGLIGPPKNTYHALGNRNLDSLSGKFFE